MENQDLFQVRIKKYLDERANEDIQFAKVYQKENKSIEECCDFIQSKVFELAKKGMKGMDNEQVFSLAVHYYDEDNISFTSHQAALIVIDEEIELTDEEKAELKEKAKMEYQRQEENKIRVEHEKANKKATEKAKERAEKEKEFESKQMSLFN